MKIQYILIPLMCCCNLLFAQSNVTRPSFKGKVIQNGSARIDTFTVQYRIPYASVADKLENVEVITDINGNFNFNLPRYEAPAIMVIKPRINTKSVLLYNGFFFEPTDNVFISLFKNNTGIIDSAHFTGVGAAKYNLIAQLSSTFPTGLKIKGISVSPPENLKNYLDKLDEIVNELQEYKLSLVKQGGLDPQMEKIITYNFADTYSNWLVAIKYWYTKSYKGKLPERELLKKHFNAFKTTFSFPKDPAMALAPAFLEKIAMRESLDLVMNSTGDSISLKTLYDTLKAKYTGYVREGLLANLFLAGRGITNDVKFQSSQYASLFRDGAKLITLPVLKTLMDYQLKTLEGQEFFYAKFTDNKGNVFDSATLKGKVILMDMWATGCTWCAVFHKAFHQDFYPLLKDNPDFVYLSVGTNRQVERWKEGIASGKFTAREYINVYTSGRDINHPFPKYYNVQGVPFILIIDREGKIVSGNIVDAKGAYRHILHALNMPKQSE
ncbi:thiol-disulfide isomerase/thioredoxin [Pedobacter africanus]|uniref:Thiol-disulfide isomerase/thioredoxin n=1 Tax=Pedobacter africanus TaxID=151894 RepID=A0ACC6L3R0_9SPHI|nr:TlpA disulfide reductase family protein [Pedobacter africanus]MDR6786060.1 thiol-disulfide isomerase/thioredoxin [Pedobacter africanus]